ncbi:MAG TPA: DinB family protein [Methylomirabilota bacterium]|nr:DinB family protein [Methylomirabilota bacterium]
MTMPPEQLRAKAYLREKGTEAPVAQIRERVADAFAALDARLDGVTERQAHGRPGAGEWSVHEIVDHLVETHPLALQELRALLENRHSPVSPIRAGLQSADPWARRWDDLRAALRRLHRDVLDVLTNAPDRPTEARAPIVMVINARRADGAIEPLQWIEECDWKACAIIFRLHDLDHLGQARKVLRGLPD